jgi:type I restriction enzyme, S subunit
MMLSWAGAGGTRNALTKGMIESLRILVPRKVDEQHAIAHILGTLDDKIELNRRMNQTLEEMARAIFKSWFADFDPVRAKAAGRQPAGLAPEIAALFPDGFEESELGEIPRGWHASRVGVEFSLTMGQSPPGSSYNETGEGAPFYQGRADFGFRYPSRRVYCTVPTRFAKPGDTLVSVRAPVGDVNMAIERCAVGRGVAALRHHSGSRSFTYYSTYHLAPHFDKFEAEGTVFGSICRDDFERLPSIAPSESLMCGFERVAAPLDDRIEANERESLAVAALRDTLLPKLISGELRLPDAEDLLSEALK